MKINKTRIVNLNYNDGKRTIYNECFDYKNGKNTLFSMDNGLGKTVIIQFLLQPFLRRNRDLAKRDFTSYFKGGNPVYIMHELLLDNGEFLLVGMAMKGDKTQDGKNKVKISAFTHKYKTENEFDIVHIPFTKQEDGINKIVTFSEAETIIKEVSKIVSQFAFYNFDDNNQKKRYFVCLENNGVNSKEWETLIKKINHEESGLSELFSNCESTPELLKKQLIPIIDEKLRVSEDRIEALQIHSKKYIDNYLAHQQEINKSVSYKNFLADVQEIDEYFNECEANLKNIDGINDYLKVLFLSINYQIENKEENSNDFLKIIASKEKEILNVKHQQASYNAYIQKDQIDEIVDNIAECRASIDSIDADIKEYSHNKAIQECARLYSRLVQKQANLFALNETLKNNEANDSEMLQTINNYKVTLKKLYSERIDDLKNKLSGIENKIEEKTNSKNKMNNLVENLREENIKNNEIIVSNKMIVKTFTNKETLISQKRKDFEEYINKNSSKSRYDVLSSLIENIIEQEKTLLNEKQELSKNKDILKNDINDLNEKLKVANDELINSRDNLLTKSHGLQDIENKKSKIAEIILKYDVHTVTNKSLIDVEKYLDNELKKYETLLKKYNKSLNEKEYQLKNLKMNKLSDIPEDILALLSDNNIAYSFGFDFVKSLDIDISDKIALVRKNPLILSALVINDNDVDTLSSVDFSKYDSASKNSIVPIFAVSSIETVSTRNISKDFVAVNDLNYLVSINHEILEDDKFNSYINDVEELVKETIANIEKTEDAIQIIKTDKIKLKSFEYDEQIEQSFITDVKNLENLVYVKEKEINGLNKQLTKYQNELETNLSVYANKEKELSDLLIYRNDVSELLSLANDFDDANNKTIEVQNIYDKNAKEISTFTNAIADVDEKLSQYSLSQLDIKNQLNIVNSKITKLDNIEGEVVEWNEDIDSLEQTISTFETKLSKDIFAIKQDIENVNDDIEYLQNDINRAENKYHVTQKDYENVDYNEELLDNYDSLIYSKESEKEDIEDEINDYERDKAVCESRYEDVMDEINELGFDNPLPESSVHYCNFDDKIDELEIELKELQDNNKETLKLYETFTSCLSKIKKYIKKVKFDGNEDVDIIKDIEELKVSIGNLEDNILSLSEYKDKVNKNENKIRHFLNSCTQKYIEIKDQLNQILVDEDILNVKEKVDIFKESLNDLLSYLELTTKNIHDEEMFVINEAIEYACSVYSEMTLIDKQSKISIFGKNRQMLQIKLPKEEDLNKDNIEYYMRDVLNNAIENNNDIDINKVLGNQIKSIHLFEQLVNGFSSVKVYIYKIEKHNLIRKEWKEINSENSGGEQFVSVFILFVSLLSYMRGDSENSNSGKVLIMDNPFAKTNAEHLLVPMFDIAKKFNTQLICFSGIGGSSVYNRFDVIYASKIIKDKYRDSEILEFSDNTQENEEVEMLGMSIEKVEEKQKENTLE